jgi:zinc protease
MKTICHSALFLALLLCVVSSPAQQLDVRTHTLKNGLKILVHEDHSIPSVALYIFYRIGSRNERPGITGLSHFFEHMMFNGAKKYGPKQFDVVMEAAGGSNNAYTSYDVTVYQDWFPVPALEKIFDLESDRIAHLAFDPQLIESERGVVASERRSRIEDDNYGRLDEQLWAAAYTAHPYNWPVIGWMVDIENWKSEDLVKYFQMGYSPSNATMVVAGDVRFDEIVALATKYLEPIPARDAPPPVTTKEPPQMGERRLRVVKQTQLPLLMVGWHVPESAHADHAALEVLEYILFFGESSRLYQRLVDREQLAISVDGSLPMAVDPTLFTVTVQPREGIATEAVEKSLFDEIERLKKEVSERELQKARNALTASFYRQMKTINGKADALGSYEIYFGDYRKLFTAADNYAKVSAEDVKRVTQQYFSEKNRTVATLVPEISEEKSLAEKQKITRSRRRTGKR